MLAGRKACWFALCLMAAGFLLPGLAAAQGNPFRDIPGDHWSLAAVRKLAESGLIEGFPDGTFKGKKVITRYDMAIHLAKLLARVDRIRVTGRAGLTPEDAVTVTRLTNEYKQELDLLGVKVDALEGRLGAVERTTQKLEKDLSNVRVEGLYQIQTHFVDEPFDFTGYPFSRPDLRNPFHRFRRAGDFPEQFGSTTLDGGARTRQSGDTAENRTGLQPIEHTVFLRFLGNPFALDGLNKNVETYAELKGVLNGPAENRLQYKFSDPPIAGDSLDDFATSVIDERRVSLNRAHLNIMSKRLELRVFAEEAITEFGGPLSLFVSDSSSFDGFAASQGVEASGTYKKFGYQGAIHKEFDVSSEPGFVRDDLFNEFAPEVVGERDAFGLRFEYFTDEEEVKNRLLFGTTYSELVTGYEQADDFNRAIGFDLVWEHRSEAEVDGSFQVVNTEGAGNKRDLGYLSDLSYTKNRWDLRAKFYSFGRDWEAGLGAEPWVETGTTSTNRNFRRSGGFVSRVAGERLIRGQAKYEADDTVFRNIDSLVFNLRYIQKWWESDPDNPTEVDGNTARKFSLQTIADLNDSTHVEWGVDYIKDVLENEKGELRNSLKVDLTLFGETTLAGELEFIDDYDREDDNGEHLSTRRGEIAVNSQVSDELFVKGYVETIKNDDRALDRTGTERFGPAINRTNGLDVNRVGGEATYAIEDDWSLKGYAERESVEDLDNPLRDGTFDRYAAEVSFNFTRALQLRYVRGLGEFDYVRFPDDTVINNFAQLEYKPTEATEIVLTYGVEYEEGGGDSGPLFFWKTNKALQLSAQTTF